MVPSPPFPRLTDLEGRVHLEEPDSAPLTEITALDVDRRGRILLPDPATGTVRIHDPDGKLSAVLGGRGRGPGEFRRPMFATFGPEGGIFVTDAEASRITRFGRDLALDTAFRLRGAYFGSRIVDVPRGVVVFALRGGRDSVEVFDVYAPDGRRLDSFGRLPAEIAGSPGWMAAARSRLASADRRVVAGFSLMYPLLLYEPGAGIIDSAGTPPPSWKPPSRPDPGTFEGTAGRRRFERWRRTFTTISAVGVYRDSLLVVEHESLDPDALEHREASYRIDVYALGPPARKLVDDVETPGHLVHAGHSLLLLTGTPARGGAWTVSRFHLERDRLP